MEWFVPSTKRKIADICSEVKTIIRNNPDWIVHVGTDSQVNDKGINYITLIGIRKFTDGVGSGVALYAAKDRETRVPTIREKLFTEALKSLQVALSLEHALSGKDKIWVHIDVTKDERFKSSQYWKQLAGMMIGNGFKYVLKPDAWLASHGADRIVKGYNVVGPKRSKKARRGSRRRKRI